MNLASCAISRCCLIGAVIIAASAAANATPVCVTNTLASYIALDPTGGCTIGDAIFFRFSAPATSVTGNPPVASASQILITPILNSTGVGLAFTAVVGSTNLFSIPNPTESDSVTYHINYTFDPLEVGSDLSLDPPFGDVSATQKYCLYDVFAGGCNLGTQTQQTVTTASPFSQITFPIPSSFIDVQTDISLNASPGHPAGFDGLTSVFVSTPSVPEPANILLTGFGLCGFSLLLYMTCKLRERKARG
jgi:hypothetical protein